jgi:pimeloyl-ACP methyl ester carboxylesterase
MRRLGKIVLVLAAIVLLAYGGLVLYAYWPQPPGVPARELATAEDRFATVDGVSIRYRVYGTIGAERPVLVMIHGFGNSLQSFRNLAPLLTDCCAVVALDLPGYGLSAKPTTFDYSNAGQARLVVAFAHGLGIDRPIYGGHSMGGAIALRAAVVDPATAGLIMIDPGIYETGVPKIMERPPFPLARMSARLFGDRAWRENFLKRSFHDPSVITPAVMDDLARTARTEDYWSGTTVMMSTFQAGGEPPLLAQVKVPAISIFGVEDRNHPDADRKRLQAAIPGSALVVVNDAGHYPHEEKAAEVAAAIKTAVASWQKLATPP